MATLGWIGLGDIGLPMMERLHQAGHEVLVWARDARRLAAAEALGAMAVETAADLGRRCAAVFLCVTDTEAVREVVFGPAGIASGSGPRSLIVDHSIIHPERTREMAARLRAEGRGRWIGAYGGKITHVGGSGAGQACKSCNQAITNATIMVWTEMLAYAERFGLDLEKLVAATEGGFADSSVRRVLVPRILSGEYPGHYASLIPKDLDIPCDMGREMQVPMPVTSLVVSLYRQHRVLAERSKDGDAPGLMDLFRSPRSSARGRL